MSDDAGIEDGSTLLIYYLILKQIVEALPAGVFVVDTRLQATGGLDNFAHLKEVAEVSLVLVSNGMVDILAALVTARRIEMAAPATGAQIGLAVLALVMPGHAAFDTGGPPATPAEQTFFAQFAAVQSHDAYYSTSARVVNGE